MMNLQQTDTIADTLNTEYGTLAAAGLPKSQKLDSCLFLNLEDQCTAETRGRNR